MNWKQRINTTWDSHYYLAFSIRPHLVLSTGPGLAFITYPQATAMMPLPQFWTVCFFLMLVLLTVDTHVSTSSILLVFLRKNRRVSYIHEIAVNFILFSVCDCGELHQYSERFVPEDVSCNSEARDLCPHRLYIQLPHSSNHGYWGQQKCSHKFF